MQRFVTAYELNSADTSFIELDEGVVKGVSALPNNLIERLVTRPRLSRVRAAVQATAVSRGDPIISHLPRLTAAIATTQRITGNRSRHLAFSFNFTDLPQGLSLAYFRNALRRVDRFITYSEYERDLYSGYFGIDKAKFQRLFWAQSPPALSPNPTQFSGQPYVCAVGGEGRDYETLSEAAHRLPHIDFVIIARNYNTINAKPSNVHVLRDVPAPITWRIAKEARFMVLPLLTERTCCGHITLVSAQLLGIPVVATRSFAIEEYSEGLTTVDPGSPAALVDVISSEYRNYYRLQAAAVANVPFAVTKYSRSHWSAAVAEFLRE